MPANRLSASPPSTVRQVELLPHSLPDTLARLLAARAAEERDVAWEAFVAEFSQLIHLAARRSARGYDNVMDRYTLVLESLRRDECKRLRGFGERARSGLGTWLVVVSSRLCVDYHRKKYGRVPTGHQHQPEVQERRRLIDLVGEAIELSDLSDESEADAEELVLRSEAGEALASSLQALSSEDRLLGSPPHRGRSPDAAGSADPWPVVRVFRTSAFEGGVCTAPP
jgi:DNA-directed RNA polymerase specialized sigma24 family protein